MRATGYLSSADSGVDWLIDPEHAQMQVLGAELARRTPQSPVDIDALIADVRLLERLICERHVFVVLDRVLPAAVLTVLDQWRERLDAEQPETWGEAVGDVVPRLREALGDNHLQVGSDTTARQLRPHKQADEGPAWETSQPAGGDAPVVTVRVRTFGESPETSEALHAGSADQSPWTCDRILVDLRGNGGGDDSFMQRWGAARLPRAFHSPRLRCLSVGEQPVMVWNYLAFLALRQPDAVPPAALAPLRHHPAPDDELTVRDWVEEFAAGDHPWSGRMLVLVDGATASSGESAAWMLREGFGARIIGGRTAGLFESANVCPYILPNAGLVIMLPSQWVQTPEPVEFVGLTPDLEVDVEADAAEVAAAFDSLWTEAGAGSS